MKDRAQRARPRPSSRWFAPGRLRGGPRSRPLSGGSRTPAAPRAAAGCSPFPGEARLRARGCPLARLRAAWPGRAGPRTRGRSLQSPRRRSRASPRSPGRHLLPPQALLRGLPLPCARGWDFRPQRPGLPQDGGARGHRPLGTRRRPARAAAASPSTRPLNPAAPDGRPRSPGRPSPRRPPRAAGSRARSHGKSRLFLPEGRR